MELLARSVPILGEQSVDHPVSAYYNRHALDHKPRTVLATAFFLWPQTYQRRPAKKNDEKRGEKKMPLYLYICSKNFQNEYLFLCRPSSDTDQGNWDREGGKIPFSSFQIFRIKIWDKNSFGKSVLFATWIINVFSSFFQGHRHFSFIHRLCSSHVLKGEEREEGGGNGERL